MNINKDDKVVQELYNENQMLYTKLGEVYDDYIQFIYSIYCKETNGKLVDEISNKIEQLQEEINKRR